MIRAISSLVAGGVELLEAEGRLARVHFVRLAALAAILIGCTLTVTLGMVGVGAGVVVMLAERIGLGQALLWTGFGVIALCGVVGGVAVASLRSED